MFLIVAGLCVVFVFVGMLGSPPTNDPAPAKTPEERDRDLDYYRVAAVKETILRALKDPESVRWGDVWVSRKGGDPVVCGFVNAKNSFGGYTGEQPFMADDERLTGPSSQPSAAFVRRWNATCSGSRIE